MIWWVAAIFFLFTPPVLAGIFLSTEILDALLANSRWAAAMLLALVTGLVAALRLKLGGLLDKSEETDHWKTVKRRHAYSERLQRRLDYLIVFSFVLGIFTLLLPPFVPLIPASTQPFFKGSITGTAAFLLFLIISWSRWRTQVDRIKAQLAYKKRQAEQRKESVQHLKDSEPPKSGGEPPNVLTVNRDK